MVKIMLKAIKRIIMAFLLIYGLNIMLSGINFYIPLNIISIGIITLLGIPGLLGIIIMFLIV